MLVTNAIEGFETAESGHSDIKGNDVGSVFLGKFEGFSSIRSLRADANIFFRFQYAPEPFPYDSMVIDNEN
jgi:hypothetical protein